MSDYWMAVPTTARRGSGLRMLTGFTGQWIHHLVIYDRYEIIVVIGGKSSDAFNTSYSTIIHCKSVQFKSRFIIQIQI